MSIYVKNGWINNGDIIAAECQSEGLGTAAGEKHRDKQNKYVVEGIHLVQEALSSGADIECVAYDVDKGIPKSFVILRIQDKVPNGSAYPMPSYRRSAIPRRRSRCLPSFARKRGYGRT